MCIVTMKSLTYAMKAKSALDSRGIASSVTGVDPSVTRHGCSYGVSFSCDQSAEVCRILDAKRIAYGDLIGRHAGKTGGGIE